MQVYELGILTPTGESIPIWIATDKTISTDPKSLVQYCKKIDIEWDMPGVDIIVGDTNET